MMGLQYASFKYDYSENLGDQIQSLAAEQFLPRLDARINRDTLGTLKLSQQHLVIMNAWFSHFPETCFPPAENIEPVFWGFHLSDAYQGKALRYFLQGAPLDYLKRHAPIGCRDQATCELLQSQGVEAFYSKCLTLTFPRRRRLPADPAVLLVDVDFLPAEAFNQKVIQVTHCVGDYYPDQLKVAMAKTLLRLYHDRAGLVVTTRLHCALPCAAMGIPVVFFGDQADRRFSPLKDLPLPIYSPKMSKQEQNQINWNPAPLEFEQEKAELRSLLNQIIQRKQRKVF